MEPACQKARFYTTRPAQHQVIILDFYSHIFLFDPRQVGFENESILGLVEIQRRLSLVSTTPIRFDDA
jgi:hypothetical protein